MKTSIKLFIFVSLFITGSFINGCSDDTTTTVITPSTPDSTVILISPANNDTLTSSINFIQINLNWHYALNSPTYELCVTNVPGAPDCNVYNTIVSDSTSRFSGSSGTYNFYWKVRIHNPVRPCPVWSEVRHITVIVP